MKTRITSMLQCRYPVILPGMSWISTPELVAAVSNAGGVGILATGPLDADETRAAIYRIRTLLANPNKPFGIGATLLMPGATENAQVAIDEQVPLVNISLGKADWIANSVHEYGGHVLATVTNSKHAEAALNAGANALMCTGHEAAAHGGDVTSLCLIPALAQHFPDTPLVAAGGFGNGQGLAAALSLGADAVAMGSRLATTQESPLAEEMKRAIVASSENDTLYGNKFDGIPARVLKTPTAEAAMNKRPMLPVIIYRAFQAARDMNIPLYKVIPGLVLEYHKMYAVAQFGAATQQIMAATVDGKLEGGVQFIGQSQGLIRDIPPVEEMMQRIIVEANQASQKTAMCLEQNDVHVGEDEEDDAPVEQVSSG